MVSRRAFLSLVAGSMSASRVAFAQEARTVALYANVGADLTHYDVDAAGAALTKRATVTPPPGVPYAWPHVSAGSVPRDQQPRGLVTAGGGPAPPPPPFPPILPPRAPPTPPRRSGAP